MSNITAIEIGPDSCVLVSVRPHSGVAEVSAVHMIGPSEWPNHTDALARRLRTVREELRLPRKARVVAWNLDAGSADTSPALAAVASAGFRIDSMLTPAQALALLAADRYRSTLSGVTAWLALNRRVAAIAVVRGSDVLFARVFKWAFSTTPATSINAELLRRYSLVTQLAPELQEAARVASRNHGAVVNAAITCGDLPDLRSLTMPLIEETDLEVETLDSTDGYEIASGADAAQISDVAPALRLACAAAMAPGPSGTLIEAASTALPTAALIMSVAGLVWWASMHWAASDSLTPISTRTAAAVSSNTPAASSVQRASSPGRAAPLPAAARYQADALTKPPDLGSGQPRTAAERVSPQAPVPQPTTGTLPGGRVSAQPRPFYPFSSSTQRAQDPSGLQVRDPGPLPVPLPRIDSILIGTDRRVAIADGTIVEIGDAIGPRVVVGIESHAVVLREPSGHEVRVPINRKTGSLRE